jgi:ribosomal protein S28E/S33
VDPAVSEVIFIEQRTGFRGEDLAQGPVRLRDVIVTVLQQVLGDLAP